MAPTSKHPSLARIFASLLAVVLIFWLASRKSFFDDTISSSFLAIALFSIFLILLRTRTNWRELAAVASLFLGLMILDLRYLHFAVHWPVWPSFLGLASLIVLAFRAIWSDGSQRRLAFFVLIPSFLFAASEWSASYFLDWSEVAHPKVLDLFLYSFDCSLHLQIPFFVGTLFQRFPYFALISVLFYLGLPIAIGLTFAGCLMRDRENALPSFVAFLLTGPLGAIFYNMFPALGPIHLLPRNFPWQPLPLEAVSRLFLEPVALSGPRNAIPSLHAAWIFLVFYYSRRLSIPEKIVADVFVVFTLLATLGTGEHYFIDLIVAVPFALLVLSLTQWLIGRGQTALLVPIGCSLALILGWFALLRYGPHIFWLSPIVPWGLSAATLAICYFAGGVMEGGQEAAHSIAPTASDPSPSF
jgi:hypothetical protein